MVRTNCIGEYHTYSACRTCRTDNQHPQTAWSEFQRPCPACILGADQKFRSRTNIAQTVVGHNAFAHQLYALGLLPSPNLDIECDAARLLESMYASHGDIIAIQYGGSNTVNTIDSYRPATPAWPAFSGGYSRDKVENMKRYYANSFSGERNCSSPRKVGNWF